ncbi:ATP-dependent DNA helicase PIF6 [Grifola frondosa]|uniref:ATP-dependent DNA helicase n=1 Tax=Grifola frondosa TaxID=5627 RepID=A0A1C7LVX3_GRIFR|nr:ATP-dependent DNA helicase PIF6 [Grifola frondosa]
MISRSFLALLSKHISIGKTGSEHADKPFGGINVIICGDFHQFPPVANKKTAPLYYLVNDSKNPDDAIGRAIYEQFQCVVILSEQVRIKDPVWADFLTRIRRQETTEEDIAMLKGLILTDPNCPPTDFSAAPWKEAPLITPRHVVREQWNAAALRRHCSETGAQNRPLTVQERFAMAKKRATHRSRKDCGGLPNMVELAIGMKVMVTMNVKTDLDVANGSRGTIVDIILDPREPEIGAAQIVHLQYPPACVIVKLEYCRQAALTNLQQGEIPIEPTLKTFQIAIDANEPKLTIKRRQMPMTAAYAFTDYRAQGQTIPYVIVDIASPPSGGELTIFNVYVALSRSSGRDTIRLLREFNKEILYKHVDDALLQEDARLVMLNEATRLWWDGHGRR